LNERSCPLCSSTKTVAKYELSSEFLAQAWRVYSSNVFNSEIVFSKTLLCKCVVCGLGFFSPSQAGGPDFYGALSKVTSSYYPSQKWEHQIALERVMEMGCRSILELGCGDGGFLSPLQQSGMEVCGVDFNLSANRKTDVPIIQADLAVFQAAKQYDCVAAFQVLEHLPDPRTFLVNMHRALNPGGLMLLAVPNQDGVYKFIPDLFKALDLPPHHVTRWTKRPLAFIGDWLKLEPVEFLTEPLRYEHYFECISRQGEVFAQNGLSGTIKAKIGRAVQQWLSPLYYLQTRSSIPGHACMMIFKKPEE
jgi:SAM-dependent methyltransferase